MQHAQVSICFHERVAEYDRRIEHIAREVHPEVALLKQVKELIYALTLDDPTDFAAAEMQDVSRVASGVQKLGE